MCKIQNNTDQQIYGHKMWWEFKTPKLKIFQTIFF